MSSVTSRCVCALRLPPAPARPVVARWTCSPSGNVIYLCESCLNHWLDNADDDPAFEPAELVVVGALLGGADNDNEGERRG